MGLKRLVRYLKDFYVVSHNKFILDGWIHFLNTLKFIEIILEFVIESLEILQM